MFYKIGFYVLLAAVILMCWVFMRSNPMKNQGAASWTEYYSNAPAETMAFLSDNFGIKAEKYIDEDGDPKTTPDVDYHSLKAAGQFWPFAGVMDTKSLPIKVAPHTMVYLTVKNYDAMHKQIVANGAKAVLTDQYAAGMKFGIYEIPGGLVIGIAQYEHVKKDK